MLGALEVSCKTRKLFCLSANYPSSQHSLSIYVIIFLVLLSDTFHTFILSILLQKNGLHALESYDEAGAGFSMTGESVARSCSKGAQQHPGSRKSPRTTERRTSRFSVPCRALKKSSCTGMV